MVSSENKVEAQAGLSTIIMMSTTFELINTGIIMGVIHVLTGPDHLSALATLCGSNIHSKKHTHMGAFCLGIKWGIGHSIGLLFVGGLLIALEGSSGKWISMDPMLSLVLNFFVGIFMLALGAYGIFMAHKNKRDGIILKHCESGAPGSSKVIRVELAKLDSPPSSLVRRLSKGDMAAEMADILETDSKSAADDLSVCLSIHSMSDGDLADYLESSVDGPSLVMDVPKRRLSDLSNDGMKEDYLRASNNLIMAASLVNKHTTPQGSIISGRSQRRCWGLEKRLTRLNPGIVALAAGVIHGVAGPGGVLGVIPAVQLRNAQLATIYLATFCLTSALVMGGFAAFYGTLSDWLAGGRQGQSANRVFMVEVGSALLSVCVGFIWLVLLVVGKLDDVFP